MNQRVMRKSGKENKKGRKEAEEEKVRELTGGTDKEREENDLQRTQGQIPPSAFSNTPQHSTLQENEPGDECDQLEECEEDEEIESELIHNGDLIHIGTGWGQEQAPFTVDQVRSVSWRNEGSSHF